MEERKCVYLHYSSCLTTLLNSLVICIVTGVISNSYCSETSWKVAPLKLPILPPLTCEGEVWLPDWDTRPPLFLKNGTPQGCVLSLILYKPITVLPFTPSRISCNLPTTTLLGLITEKQNADRRKHLAKSESHHQAPNKDCSSSRITLWFKRRWKEAPSCSDEGSPALLWAGAPPPGSCVSRH